jgi:hypothetical protein
MTPTGWNLESPQIRTDEDDTSGRGRREDTNADRNARMKAYAGCFDRPLDRRFESQKCGSKLGINMY